MLLFYEGPLWYQRYFSYHKRPNTRVFIYFGAANYQAGVWLNGKKIGDHAGGFTAFNFDVSAEVAEGNNSLVVEVNSSRNKDGVPALNTDCGTTEDSPAMLNWSKFPIRLSRIIPVQLAKGTAGQDCRMGTVQR